MLRLTFNSLSIILAIRGTISQQTCCEKKTVNNIEYILSQDEVASNPSCVNGCIYQEADNPSSYACFVHAFNEVGCSVDVDQSNTCNKNCSSCNSGSRDYVVSGDVYAGNTDERWKVENLLTWSIPEVFPQPGMNGNYWLAPSGMQGEFVLRFDQSRTVDTITIVNARNAHINDRGTNEFKVYLADSENGPWTEVLHDFLDDPRNTNGTVASVPPRVFNLPNPICGQYVRFQIISWYGYGGGLQYFSTCPLKCEEGWEPYKNKCYKKYSPETDISWMNANFNCNNERGQLASIPNEETNDFIKNHFGKESTYIGGFATRQVPDPDSWAWTDGTAWSYMNWHPNEPNNIAVDEHCLEWNGEWNDLPCYWLSTYRYICQKYPTY